MSSPEQNLSAAPSITVVTPVAPNLPASTEPSDALQESESKPTTEKHKNLAMTAWRYAAGLHGYLKAGSFKPLPKKTTEEHRQIKETQARLIQDWQEKGIPAEVLASSNPEKKKRKRKKNVQDGREQSTAIPKKSKKKKVKCSMQIDDTTVSFDDSPVKATASEESSEEKC